MIYKFLEWVTTNAKGPVQALVLLVMSFPFVVIVILFLMMIGKMSSPLLDELQAQQVDHSTAIAKYNILADSMVQINRVAKDYYVLLEAHTVDSKKKDIMIHFLVIEACRRDHVQNPRKCDRLEAALGRD